VRSTAVVADPRHDSAVMLDQVALGKMLQGRVMAVLTDGTSLVRLDAPMPSSESTEVRLQLPPGLNPGDELNLTLLAREPHPTFGLSLSGQGSGIWSGSAPTELSSAAQLIGQALQHANNGSTLHGVAPLQSEPGRPEAGQLAHNLKTALESSGLFYESHLREWSEGARALEQLLREPQNQARDGQALAAQMLPQQLDTLEQRCLSWQGELWPGQQLHWKIEEEPQRQGGGQAGETGPSERSAWQTELRLNLPHLGEVKATLRLNGDRAQLQLQVDGETAASALQESRTRLVEAMGAAGTELDAFTVKRHETPG